MQKIAKVEVHLISMPITGGLTDATRKVERVGYTVVRLTTDQGLEGFGLTYHEAGGEATRSLIERNIAPRLIGRNPFETEVLWTEFYHYLRGIGRKGLMLCALSAVDIALWDLKGKILNLPLFRLLGGSETTIPVYASGGWTSYDDDQLVDEMNGMVESGYTKIKFKVGVDNGANLQRDLRRVRLVRDAVGPEITVMLDANNCWDAATAVQFANRVKELDVLFLEEPVPADDVPGLARNKSGTDLPLATGEHEYTKFGARDLILAGAADVLQMDGVRAGGYTEMLKIAAITQAWNLKFAPHAMEDIHIHLMSAVPNSLFLERLLIFVEISSNIFTNASIPKDGFMTLSERPGLGLRLNMDFISAHEEK